MPQRELVAELASLSAPLVVTSALPLGRSSSSDVQPSTHAAPMRPIPIHLCSQYASDPPSDADEGRGTPWQGQDEVFPTKSSLEFAKNASRSAAFERAAVLGRVATGLGGWCV
jgi:hypothetical protein